MCQWLKYWLSFAGALFIFLSSATSHADATPDPDQELLQKMTLEQRVGQLFIFGFMGTSSEHSLDDLISKLHPGGILVFSRNIHTVKQTAELLFRAQVNSVASSQVPLLIAVDQEGGDVIRIKTLPQLPSALGLAEAGDKSLIHDAGLQTALVLKALGFNMDLAPVLDVADPQKDSFIGTRAFGKNPQIVTEMGLEFADGLRDGGVLPTAKHFPGHGGVKGDSHLVTPEKNIELDTLLTTDLVPYTELTRRGGANAIMVAHIAFPKIDSSMAPATYSKTLISDVLREQLGFQGIVMTDDIEMGGAGSGSALDHAKRAINAGVDLVMMAWNRKLQYKVVRGVVAAVQKGEISDDRINESVLRILKIKRKFASFQTPAPPNTKSVLAVIRNLGVQSVAQKTSEKLFNSYKAKVHEEPRRHATRVEFDDLKSTKFLVYSLNESFYRSFKSYKQKLNSHFESLSQVTASQIDVALTKYDSAYALIYISGTGSARLANSLSEEDARRTIIVNSESPGLIRNPRRFADVLDVYFKYPDSGALTADYLYSLAPESRRPSSQDESSAKTK